jgi:hypothetical protein
MSQVIKSTGFDKINFFFKLKLDQSHKFFLINPLNQIKFNNYIY